MNLNIYNIPDSNKVSIPENNLSIEEARIRVDNAMRNPIPWDRFTKINERMDELYEEWLDTGEENKSEEDALYDEIAVSTAFADSHQDFLTLLEAITEVSGQIVDFEKEWLEHEYRHFLEAARVGFQNIRYGVTYIKSETGRLQAIPRVISDPDENWSFEETIMKHLEVLKAPDNDLSDDDIEDIERLERKLAELQSRE